MLHIFTPHYRVERVEQLTPNQLEAWGVKSLLLDVDCTLKAYSQTDVSPEVATWIHKLQGVDIGLCLVSNGRGERITRFAQRVGLPHVALAMKPLPTGLRRAIRQMQFASHETAMVGDQVFADIMAARLAGVISIWVEPIRPEEEPWFTRMKRPAERLMLGTHSDPAGTHGEAD